MEKTFVEEEEDCDRTFSTIVTYVKVCLRRNEVKKLETSLAILTWTRSTQAERLEGCIKGIREEGTDTNKDSDI